jgi:uncharacterized membrane protein YebE (DUF533 family)
MLDPKKLLNDLLGSQLPGSGGSVRDGATKVQQMAKDNPLATGALVAVLLGTRTGRNLAGTAIKLGGLAAIGSVAYNAYKNAAACRYRLPSVAGAAGRGRIRADACACDDRRRECGRAYR